MPPKYLSAVAALVLSSLAEEPRHGYGLKKNVRDRSGGDVAPGATSLYRTVWQLCDDGLIAETTRRPPTDVDDERRRYFQITPAGRRALAAEIGRLGRLLEAVRPRGLALPKPRS
jgi:DNA-binding PadR family transcriptional regulator